MENYCTLVSDVLSRSCVDHVVVAAEIIPETVTVDGIERPTRNSTGKVIHGTVKGIENFWRWFGKSITVDAAGKPIVHYHGTHRNFDTFNTNRALGDLIFVSEHINEAACFAGNCKGANIMPVYVRTVRPYPKGCMAHDEVKVGLRAKKAKYDAIYVHDSMADPYNLALFLPNQLKSAVGNNGQFSLASDSVLS